MGKLQITRKFEVFKTSLKSGFKSIFEKRMAPDAGFEPATK